MRSVRTHGRSAPGGLDAFPLQRCKNLHSGRARAPRRRCLPAGLRARYAFWWRGRAVGEIFLAASSGSLGICRTGSQFSKIAVREFLRRMGNSPGNLRCFAPRRPGALPTADGQITARLREDREQGLDSLPKDVRHLWVSTQPGIDHSYSTGSATHPAGASSRELTMYKGDPRSPGSRAKSWLAESWLAHGKSIANRVVVEIGALAKGHDP
jgi:hypothetical protein